MTSQVPYLRRIAPVPRRPGVRAANCACAVGSRRHVDARHHHARVRAVHERAVQHVHAELPAVRGCRGLARVADGRDARRGAVHVLVAAVGVLQRLHARVPELVGGLMRTRVPARKLPDGVQSRGGVIKGLLKTLPFIVFARRSHTMLMSEFRCLATPAASAHHTPNGWTGR